MRATIFTAVMGLLSFLFSSCSSPHSSHAPTQRPREITSAIEDEGFIDLAFSIDSHKKLADGSQELRVSGLHQGQPVGLELVLGPQWKKGALDVDMPIVTYQGQVFYRSVGDMSDTFIHVLDDLYGTGIKPIAFRAETILTGISLEGEPSNLAEGPTKIKLFYESDEEGRYAELFTNIDLRNGIVELREKDPEYRRAVVNSLSAE